MKRQIPKFKSLEEERRFWDTRDSTQFLDQMTEVSNIKFPKPKHKSVVVELEPRFIDALKKISRTKHLPYHTIIQRWLKERLSAEMS